MTLNEAVKQGISRVFDPAWTPKDAYLKLDLVNEGHGPWVHLFSVSEQKILGIATPQTMLYSCVDWNEEGWEKYEGEVAEDDH